MFSTVEQEIGFQSEFFIGSLQSTWSSNIREERKANFNYANTNITFLYDEIST